MAQEGEQREKREEYYLGNRFYRVKDQSTGHEYTTANPVEGEKVLDKPALDSSGVPLPGKPNVPKDGIPPGSASSIKADAVKEGRSA